MTEIITVSGKDLGECTDYEFEVLLEYIAKKDTTLKEVSKDIPRYYLSKKTLKCKEDQKEAILGRLRESFRNDNSVAKIDETDGIKAIHNDGSWFLVRPSGTEPIFRIYVESEAPEKTENLLKSAEATFKEIAA